MILLKLISWQYARKHVLRSLLTTVGIALGVAVFVGMHTANQSVLAAFRQTVDRIAGKTQLQVMAGESGFGEEVLERVQSVPEVKVAVPVIEAVVDPGLKGQGNLLIIAVDMTGDRSLRDYDLEGGEEDAVEDPLVFLAQPDSLIVTRAFADRNGLSINSRMLLQTMEGPKQFTVRGLMKPGGLASGFGGNIAIMDVYAAQMVFGRGRKIDRIDLALREGVSLEQGRAAIRRLLGVGYDVEPPSSRGRNFESVLRVYTSLVEMTSLFALFIGMFIIYNSFAIAVTQRRAEIGILRALGATREQVRNVFLAESAVAGSFGSALGIVCGLLLANVMAGYIGGLLEGVYGVAERAEEVGWDPRLLAGAFLVGVVTSMLAGWIPARNAARVDPVKALQKGKYQVLSAGENRFRQWTAIFLGAVALACFLGGGSNTVFYAGYLSFLLAALLLAPAVSRWLSRLIRPVMKAVLPVEGSLAADSLLQAPRRTSATVAALMFSLSLVVGLGGMARSSQGSIRDWMESVFNPDLFVSSSENLSVRQFHFPGSMQAALRAMDGVEEVQAVRSFKIDFKGAQVMLISVELGPLSKRIQRRIVLQGDFEEMYRVASEGKGVIVSDNLAQLHRLRLNDEIAIPTPSGLLRKPIAGIVRDYSSQEGAIFIDRSVFKQYWKEDSIDILRVYLKPGTDASLAKQRILERFEGQRRLFVLLNKEVKDWVMKLTDQWFGLTFIQIAVAVLVAVLGVVNTLTVSITDRRRELGVLRAVGGMRAQIRRTIWMEALGIGAIGLIMGLALGAMTLYYQLEMARRSFSGIALDYEFPLSVAAALLPVIFGAAFVASLVPAESAARGSLVEALEYE